MKQSSGVIKEWRDGRFKISTSDAMLDRETIHGFLSKSYWAQGMPIEIIEKSIQGSLCFGVYRDDRQIGFARVISDHATFAYIADVFILEEHRGGGLAKWLLKCLMSHPELQRLRRWFLCTRDAHGLYRKFGFDELKDPERYMEIRRPGIYKS